mgnify:FL=1
MEAKLSDGFLYRFKLPSKCKAKLKSIAFWESIIADEANQTTRRVNYCNKQLKLWTKDIQKLDYLEEMAKKIKPSNRVSKTQTGKEVVAPKKKTLSFLDKRIVGKYIESGDLVILENKILFKDFKKLFKYTNAIVSGLGFMSTKVNENQVDQWIKASNAGHVLNTYFADDTDKDNANTMSICVFENADREKFPFIFFSQEETPFQIEKNIEGDTLDALNDLHAPSGGRDFYISMIFKKNALTLGNTSPNQKLIKK